MSKHYEIPITEEEIAAILMLAGPAEITCWPSGRWTLGGEFAVRVDEAFERLHGRETTYVEYQTIKRWIIDHAT
jgi:hypothetical protein